MKKCKAFWASLDGDKTINGKLLFFQFTTAVLAGILLGIALTPFRSTVIGSYNGNGTGGEDCGNGIITGCEEDED